MIQTSTTEIHLLKNSASILNANTFQILIQHQKDKNKNASDIRGGYLDRGSLVRAEPVPIAIGRTTRQKENESEKENENSFLVFILFFCWDRVDNFSPPK